MISRYEVYLNGKALSGVSSDILITDVQYNAPQIRNNSYSVAKRQGARIHARRIDSASVIVSFMIRTYDTAQRTQICNDVQRWAKDGGELRINDRPGQRLRCVCDSFPVITSALKWLDVLSVTFTAYALPYWQETIPSTLTMTNASETGSLFVPGVAEEAFVEADITAGGTLTSVSLTVNGKTMTLSEISVASGDVIKIAYDDNMIQSIKVGNTSLLNKRTGADDLVVRCGEINSFSFTANTDVSVTFRARGLWL